MEPLARWSLPSLASLYWRGHPPFMHCQGSLRLSKIISIPGLASPEKEPLAGGQGCLARPLERWATSGWERLIQQPIYIHVRGDAECGDHLLLRASVGSVTDWWPHLLCLNPDNLPKVTLQGIAKSGLDTDLLTLKQVLFTIQIHRDQSRRLCFLCGHTPAPGSSQLEHSGNTLRST